MRFHLLLTLFLISQLSLAQSAIWSPAEVLFPTIAQPTPPEIGGDLISPCFDAKSDGSNRLHLVWSDKGLGETEILYSIKGNEGFSIPENISQMPQTASAWPSLANSVDQTYCAWTEMSEDYETGGIYFGYKTLSGNWSTAILASKPDTEPLSIFPNVCVTSMGQVVMVYNIVEFDEINIEYLFELRFKIFNPGNLTFNELPSPEVNSSVSAFRPVLVADNIGGFHCLWYDGGTNNIPSGRFVAHSYFNGQNWTPTTLISDASLQVWDDLPLQCLINNAGDLTVLWTSFDPTENQMAIKYFGQGFQPSQILPFNTTDWDAAITQNGDLFFVGDSQEGSLDYAIHSANSWTMGSPLVYEQGEIGSYPELVINHDTLYLFWEEEGQLFLRTRSTKLSGIIDNVGHEFKLYPNPSTTYFKISSTHALIGGQARIFDATGRLLVQQNISEKDQINVGLLPPGVYCLSVAADGVQHTQTFVKH